jgi:hypothetical protein
LRLIRVESWWLDKRRYTDEQEAFEAAREAGVFEVLHEVTTNEMDIVQVPGST